MKNYIYFILLLFLISTSCEQQVGFCENTDRNGIWNNVPPPNHNKDECLPLLEYRGFFQETGWKSIPVVNNEAMSDTIGDGRHAEIILVQPK